MAKNICKTLKKECIVNMDRTCDIEGWAHDYYSDYCLYVPALLGISVAKAVLIVLLQTVAAQGLYLWLETWRMLALHYIGVIR